MEYVEDAASGMISAGCFVVLDACLIQRVQAHGATLLGDTMRPRVIPLLTIPLFLPAGLSAQQAHPIAPGQRVRITVPELGIELQEAEFAALDGGVLTLLADSAVSYPLDATTRLDVYAGQQSHPWRGAGIGFLTGWTLGFTMWYATGQSCYEGASTFNCAAVIGGGLGAVTGALIGALVGGFAWKTERWNRVSAQHLQVHVSARSDGFGLGVSVAF